MLWFLGGGAVSGINPALYHAAAAPHAKWTNPALSGRVGVSRSIDTDARVSSITGVESMAGDGWTRIELPIEQVGVAADALSRTGVNAWTADLGGQWWQLDLGL